MAKTCCRDALGQDVVLLSGSVVPGYVYLLYQVMAAGSRHRACQRGARLPRPGHNLSVARPSRPTPGPLRHCEACLLSESFALALRITQQRQAHSEALPHPITTANYSRNRKD
jgi:hypothetical protein